MSISPSPNSQQKPANKNHVALDGAYKVRGESKQMHRGAAAPTIPDFCELGIL